MKSYSYLFRIAPVLVALAAPLQVRADFISPSTIQSDAVDNPFQTPILTTPAVLISDAGALGSSYLAPNPRDGGNGTSWHTQEAATLPTSNLTFDFAAQSDVDTLYVWDYYGHSPTDYELTLYTGLNRTGTALTPIPFSIVPGASFTSTLHTIPLGSAAGVQSGYLKPTNLSAVGGFGLAEIGFNGTVVPEPSTLSLLGIAVVAGLLARRRSASKA